MGSIPTVDLQCPNCAKRLTVSEQYAGQLVKCQLCGSTFTVPSLPGAPPPIPLAPPPPSAPPRPETFTPSETTSGPAASGQSRRGDHPRHASARVQQVCQRVAEPAYPSLGAGSRRSSLVFFLTFLPWEGAYPGGYGVYTQNAWQCWGERTLLTPSGTMHSARLRGSLSSAMNSRTIWASGS